jgi:hypothetical protein
MGFGDGGISRSGGMMVSGSSGSMARSCGHMEAREGERSGGRVALPHRSAPAAGSRSTAAMAAAEPPVLGFFRWRRQLRLGIARARVGALNRGGCGSWACRPEAARGGTAPHRGQTRPRARA